MKQKSTLFLKTALCLIGLAAIAFSIFALLPAITSNEAGYYLPVLILLLVSILPFFTALYQAFKLLTFIDKNNAFTDSSIKTLQNIKYSAIAMAGLYTTGMPFIYYAGEKDDAPGVILIGLIIIGASLVVAVFAAVLQKLLQNAADLKMENDLTV